MVSTFEAPYHSRVLDFHVKMIKRLKGHATKMINESVSHLQSSRTEAKVNLLLIMSKKVLLIIAKGSETVEIVASVDTLRNCKV
jgi:hypothetical protein